MRSLPLLWYCFFPYALLWLHKMLRLELSSHVGGEMTGVAAVFSAGLQFYVWLASANSVASCWSPSLHGRHLPWAEHKHVKESAGKNRVQCVLCKMNLFLFVKLLCKLGNYSFSLKPLHTELMTEQEIHLIIQLIRNCLSNRKSVLTPSACLNLQKQGILCQSSKAFKCMLTSKRTLGCWC